jgi:hypothetical protein
VATVAGVRCGGSLPKRTFSIDNQFCERNLDEWERSLDADIASNGSSEITVRDTCMFYDAKERFLGRLNIERMRGIESWMPSKKLIKVIEELKRKGRL